MSRGSNFSRGCKACHNRTSKKFANEHHGLCKPCTLVNREWLVLTVAEPLPVFDTHPEGPFYVAGSKWYEFPENLPYVTWRAEHLRSKGFTVTITTEKHFEETASRDEARR